MTGTSLDAPASNGHLADHVIRTSSINLSPLASSGLDTEPALAPGTFAMIPTRCNVNQEYFFATTYSYSVLLYHH